MAVDTAARRFSFVALGPSQPAAVQVPDVGKPEGWRPVWLHAYYGLDWQDDAPVVETTRSRLLLAAAAGR
ncbi:MAG: hypothetical protein IIC82_08180 [Chloroflexi bacterium]|nr:hypothetical protein [Chloroflexota bacterium]